MQNADLRIAAEEDAEALLLIYAHYVEHTAVTFEYEVPSLCEFRNRISRTLRKYPYLVADSPDGILGFAYTSPFIGRKAYDWSAETSIYLKDGMQGNGLGKRLYLALEAISRMQHIYNLNACIAYPKTDDRYLTKNSVMFHMQMGYRFIGQFDQCGYKFGNWYDMVWMEKQLSVHPKCPPPVILFPQLNLKQIPEA